MIKNALSFLFGISEKYENNKFLSNVRSNYAVSYIVVALIGMVLYTVTYLDKVSEFNIWTQNYSYYFIDNKTPLLSTLDTYKWVRYAEEIRDGKYEPGTLDHKMYYPEGLPRPGNTPLPSLMIKWYASIISNESYPVMKRFTFDASGNFKLVPPNESQVNEMLPRNGNLVYSALFLPALLAGLVAFPVLFFFNRIGYVGVAVAGAVSSIYAIMIYQRSLFGRLDTDLLNIFFPMLIALFISLIPRAKALITDENVNQNDLNKDSIFVGVYSALAGLSTLGYYFWYEHSAFNIVFLGILVVIIIAQGHQLRNIIIGAVAFILFSNPLQIFDGVTNLYYMVVAYILNTDTSGATGFPNVYTTVSEAIHRDNNMVLVSVSGNALLTSLALLFFLIFTVVEFKKLLPILPFFAVGLLSFVSSQRFSMYLSVYYGAGLGYMFTLIFKFILESKGISDKLGSIKFTSAFNVKSYVMLFVSCLVGLTIYSYTGKFARSGSGGTAVDIPIAQAYLEMKNILPKDSVFYTWWDFGLVMEYLMEMGTFHDGMSQNTPKTHFVAKSLATSNQTELRNIMGFLVEKNMTYVDEQLKKGRTPYELSTEASNYQGGSLKDKNIYLVFTQDMLFKFVPIQQLGLYDLKNNKRNIPPGTILECRESQINVTWQCQGGGGLVTLDTSQFLINQQPINHLTIVNNGQVVMDNLQSPYKTGVDLILYNIGMPGSFSSQLVIGSPEYLYSNLMQMFLAGHYDSNHFVPVYQKLPYILVYKVID